MCPKKCQTTAAVKKLRVLSCFSGIGGFDLGLERAGMRVVGQIEIEKFPIKILEKHWPGVKRWADIHDVTADDIRRSCRKIDVICGGFPCQDISGAGKGEGLTGEKSGLWREMWRLIRDLRPTWVLIENSPNLRLRGGDGIFSALEILDYTCWPIVVPASALGAGHRRQRVFIVARLRTNTDSDGLRIKQGRKVEKRENPTWFKPDCSRIASEIVTDTYGNGQRSIWAESVETGIERKSRHESDRRSGPQVGADADSQGGEPSAMGRGSAARRSATSSKRSKSGGGTTSDATDTTPAETTVAHADRTPSEGRAGEPEREASEVRRRPERFGFEFTRHWQFARSVYELQHEWEVPRSFRLDANSLITGLGRTVHGLSGRLDKHRLKALGNSVVPQIIEFIGRWIIYWEGVYEMS